MAGGSEPTLSCHGGNGKGKGTCRDIAQVKVTGLKGRLNGSEARVTRQG